MITMVDGRWDLLLKILTTVGAFYTPHSQYFEFVRDEEIYRCKRKSAFEEADLELINHQTATNPPLQVKVFTALLVAVFYRYL
jgi:hypothetical protein